MSEAPHRHKTTRRGFLKGGAAALAMPGLAESMAGWAPAEAPAPVPPTAPGVIVNDIHSQLNATQVASIVRPGAVDALQAAIREAARQGATVSIAGGRHAMGGQQFCTAATLLDTTAMNGVLGFDADAGIVEVEGGIQWPKLVTWLHDNQEGDAIWSIVQKQTGADRLSIGGALSANVHSRGLALRPFIQDVESFVLIDGDGNSRRCSRTENAELFSLVIGGYGLFGAIGSVRLRLAPRRKMRRRVEIIDVAGAEAAFADRIANGYAFGDLQYSTAKGDASFLRRGIFSCYRPIAVDEPIPASRAELSSEDWGRLSYLSHADRKQAFEVYAEYYLNTDGQVYWSDTQQMSYYLDDYHAVLSQQLGESDKATEMITEIYVPRSRLADFMGEAAEYFNGSPVEVIYGTIRLIERDGESFLAWPREPWACVIFNLHVAHTDEGLERAADAFRDLIDMARSRGGSYFLTYHRWARREQVEACYPQMADFLRKKLEYDPDERFQSDWYRYYREMFAAG